MYYREVFFDLETKSFFEKGKSRDPSKLGVSIISVYKRVIDQDLKEKEGKLLSFWENELEKLWPLFTEADRIIGYNTLNFDILVLEPYAPFPLAKLPHFDIFQKIKEASGKKIPLNEVAKQTLGREKIDLAEKAIDYWLKKDKESLLKLKRYCEQDVLLTKDIYDYGLKEKVLKFKDKWNNLQIINIDFSYSEENKQNQASLF